MKTKTLTLQSFLYLAAYSLLIIYRILNLSFLGDYFPSGMVSFIRRSIIILLIIAFLVQKKFKRKRILMMSLILLVCFIIYFNIDNADFLCLSLLILTPMCIDVHIDDVIKTTLYLNIIILIVVFGFCFIGLVPDLTYSHTSLFSITMTAHAYGFHYYSDPQFIILYVTIMFLYFRHNLIDAILMFIVNIIAYWNFTASLPLIIFTLAILIYVVVKQTKIMKTKNVIFSNIMASIPLLIAGLSVLVCYFYNSSNKLMASLNSLLHSRVAMGHVALTQYGITIFGQKVIMQGTYTATYGNYDQSIGYFYIDNEYLYMLVAYGLVFTIVVLIIYGILIKNSIKSQNEWLFIWSMATIMFAIVNSAMIKIQFNPIILIGVITSSRSVMEDTRNGDHHIFTIKQ